MAINQQADDRVGVIGLGLLGTALAERLLAANFRVCVWNRTPEKAQPLVDRGAVWTENPLADCDRIVISLFNSDVVDQVLQRFSDAVRPGQLIVDTTTGNPQETAALGRRLAERGAAYLESPIAASSEQTRQGEALAIVAGPRDAFTAAEQLFRALVAKSVYVGRWGNAAKTKLVNNLILGLNRAALAEGLALARHLDLEPDDALAVVREGSAYSTVMDTKGRKMVEGDFTPQARLAQHLKDVRLILEQASQNGTELPFSQLHSRILQELVDAGLGDLDNSAIIRAYDS